jgi:hypothetical protein
MPVLLDRSFFRVSGSFRARDRKVNMWLGVRPDVRGLPRAMTPLPPVPENGGSAGLDRRTGRIGFCTGDTNGLMHETVKEPAMPGPLLRLGSLAPLFGLIVLGGRGRNRLEFEGTCAQHSASGCRGTQSARRRGSRRASTVAATFEPPAVSRWTQRAKVRRPDRANARSS